MIVVNSLPKSGSHALMALLDRMGLKRYPGTLLPAGSDAVYAEGARYGLPMLKTVPDNCYMLGHVPATHSLDGFVVMNVQRDPRNCLVSYVRYVKEWEDRDVTIQEAIKDYWSEPFIPRYRRFMGWVGRSISFRFEALPARSLGHGEGIYREHQTDFNTRTGTPSDWRQVWNEEIEAVWIKHGGPQLLIDAGYAS